ncbi:MAG: hypothetical protein QXZ70_02765 [Candidatus Bathyarchaeia archaeon]
MAKMRITNVYPCLATFTVAFFIRALPEMLSGPHPVGYDLLAGYAPSISALPDTYPLKLFGWFWSPLAIYVLWIFWVLTRMDLYLLLKVAGPVFYGLFVFSFYYLLWKGLGWNTKKSFVTALVFLLQPAVLRTGWDQLREELGFVFLFVLLAETRLDLVTSAKARPFMVFVLSVLVVFSHQLAAVLLFVVVVWQFISRLVKEKRLSLKWLVVFLPSVFVFVWGVYGQFVSPSFSDRFVPIQLPSGTGFFAFTNYFLSDPRFIGGDWFRVLAYVGSLSLYCILPLVPFAVKGFFRDYVFSPILLWLCTASYSIVVFPWFAFSHYWWWILLLPIPLTVYVGNALERFRVFADSRQFKKALIGFLLLSVVGIGYACSVVRLGYPYAYTYMPSGLVESAIPFEDIAYLETAVKWLNENAPLNSLVIVEEKMQGFASIGLRSDISIRVAPALLKLSAVIVLINLMQNNTYAVWYTDDVWQDASFGSKTAEFGRIAVFKIYK